MSALATEYVRRHVIRHVNPVKKSIIQAIASVANDHGLASSYRQQDMADDTELRRETVNRAIKGLTSPPPGAPGPFLAKEGRGRYRILGLPHDAGTCGNDECRAEFLARRENGGKLSDRKRAQAAARARRFRARQREKRQNGE